MKPVGIIAVLLVIGASLVGCSGDDDTSDGTTTTLSPVTTQATATGGGAQSTTTTSSAVVSTTAAPEDGASTATFPRYQIVARETGEDGDIVVVLLDPESYESLTDIDLRNVVADVVEEYPPILEAHIVDSAEAAAVVLDEAPSPEAEALLQEHYFVRLEEGFRMVFSGPYESWPDAILGS